MEHSESVTPEQSPVNECRLSALRLDTPRWIPPQLAVLYRLLLTPLLLFMLQCGRSGRTGDSDIDVVSGDLRELQRSRSGRIGDSIHHTL